MVPMPPEEELLDGRTDEMVVDGDTVPIITITQNNTNNTPPRNHHPPTTQRPSSSSLLVFKSNYINFMLIIISFLLLNYQKNQINNLKNELTLQQQKYNEYFISNQLINNNMTISINNLKTTTSQHEKLLIRLTTNTSNADVLDKLKDTKSYVNQKLGTSNNI